MSPENRKITSGGPEGGGGGGGKARGSRSLARHRSRISLKRCFSRRRLSRDVTRRREIAALGPRPTESPEVARTTGPGRSWDRCGVQTIGMEIASCQRETSSPCEQRVSMQIVVGVARLVRQSPKLLASPLASPRARSGIEGVAIAPPLDLAEPRRSPCAPVSLWILFSSALLLRRA